MTRIMLCLLPLPLLAASPAYADGARSCPAAVTASVKKAYPQAAIASCAAERENGKPQFEVVVTRAAGDKIELDVAPDGTILQIEEPSALDALPDAVMRAFAARYPRARANKAEKQTSGSAIRYEIGFPPDHGHRAATFAADGSFVEEE